MSKRDYKKSVFGRTLLVAVGAVGLLILLGACSDPGDIGRLSEENAALTGEKVALTEERDVLQSQVDQLQQEIDALQQDNDQLTAESNGLSAELVSMTEERDVLSKDMQELQSQMMGIEEELTEAQLLLTESEAEVTGLLSRYDEQIRADLQAEIDAEVKQACAEAVEQWRATITQFVQWNDSWSPITNRDEVVVLVEECAQPGRNKAEQEFKAGLQAEVDAEIQEACASAEENYDDPVSDFIDWDSRWTEVTTRGDLTAKVEECAEAERSKSEEQRRQDFLDSCDRIEVDQIEKNADALRGECLVMYAYIVQFDSNTGKCGFHAELSRTRTTSWWRYDVRSSFEASSRSNCPELDNIDGDDFVKVWAVVQGTETYSTSLGGRNTVPSFRIEEIELVRKN